MTLVFLTPQAALVALGVLVPLGVLAIVRLRADRLRRLLGLVSVRRRALVVPLVLAGLAAGLIGAAAAQPVVERTNTQHVRTDAEAYVVLDISRSMLARSGPSGRTRLARARAIARRIRSSLSGVPVGIASVTDRALPHLFPSADEDVFAATLRRAIDIERPPPRSSLLTTATSLDALAAMATQHFFSPAARKRLLIVLTDGESRAPDLPRLARLLHGPPEIKTVFVHVWGADERVYTRGATEPQYRPDPGSRAALARLADATGGTVYDETRAGAAAHRARADLGRGPTVAKGLRRTRTGLAPFLALAAVLPLSFLLTRRDR